MCAARRNWTDEVFSLFVGGRLGALSARDVCDAVDWISAQPELLAQLDETQGSARQGQLKTLVYAATRRACWRLERPMAADALSDDALEA